MRTFVAIDLAPELKITMQALIRSVKKTSRGVKWAAPSGMHLTLKFLGRTAPEKITEIADVISLAAQKAQPFTLKLKGTGFFPPGKTKSAKVLWAGTDESPALAAFQKEIESGFENLGFAREQRPFHPHLTLGRVKFPEGLEAVIAELEKYKDSEFGEMIADRVTLFESILKPEGAEYAVLSEAGLG